MSLRGAERKKLREKVAVPEEFSWGNGGRTQLGSAMYTTYIAEIFLFYSFRYWCYVKVCFLAGANGQ